MSFQYYETLRDKSEKHLLYLCEHLEPKFTIEELKFFLEDYSNTQFKNQESEEEPLNGFVFIGDDFDTEGDLKTLNPDQLKLLFQVFISREINNKRSIKWRIYQSFKYLPGLLVESILINSNDGKNNNIDLIVDIEGDKKILIACFEILDLKIFNEAVKQIQKFKKDMEVQIDKIIFATYKCYRNLPLEQKIDLTGSKVEIELWVEWFEEQCPFNGEDLLIVNNNDLELAGFNYTNTQDLLDYVYESCDGGQIIIFKQRNFFSESDKITQDLEVVWKGIMLKTE